MWQLKHSADTEGLLKGVAKLEKEGFLPVWERGTMDVPPVLSSLSVQAGPPEPGLQGSALPGAIRARKPHGREE